MATTDVVPRESAGGMSKQRIVNDMSIQVATVNGSGSQSSNTVLLRSIFQMGVPVSGKNMFPSNIAGLPTWYTIRANKNGYIGRKKEIDFLVAMNPETATEDTMSLAPGASVLYDEPLALHKLRNDLIFYSVPYDKIVAAGLPRGQAAQAGQEHGVRRRGGQPADHRHGRGGEGHPQAVREESEGRQSEPGSGAGRIRLRQGESGKARRLLHRAHGQDRGQDHHRRQLRRRARLHVRGMHGRHLVSDHAIFVARRNDDRVHEGIPHRPRRQGDVRHRAGRRRTGRDRHGHRRRLGGRAQHDGDRRPWHLAHGGVRRLGLLRRSPGRDLGHPARRPVHRPSHADFARRYSFDCLPLARRHEAHHADSLLGRRMLHHGDRGLQSRGAIPDAGVCHVRSRSRHEQLDVRPVPVSDDADQARQGARARKTSTASADSRATKTSTATALATARCRAPLIPQRLISHAAAATTKRLSTASAPTTSRTTWSG